MPSWIRTVAIVGVCFALGYWVTNSDGERSSLTHAELQRVVSRINEVLPMMIDQDVEITSVIAMSADLVMYSRRYVAFDVADIEPDNLEIFLSAAQLETETQSRTPMCTSPETRDIIDLGITLRYRYHDAQDVYLYDVDVTLADCLEMGF